VRTAHLLIPAACAALLALASCDAPLPEQGFEGLDACTDLSHREAAYFDDVMLPQLFEPYCVYCHSAEREGIDRHGAPDFLDLDDFDSARQGASVTWNLVSAREMPPMGRTPSTEELELLVDWLNCVAPVAVYAIDEALAEQCPDPDVTWADAGPVLAANCTGCHDSALSGPDRGGAPESANYDSAAGVLAVGESLVWSRIFAGEMPPIGDLVPEEDARTLWAWLSCGGPE
jgi:mono/diheme cytochrome c family protein